MNNLKLLVAKNIQKSFGKKVVLRDVDMEVFRNDILGMIGPNGAGKTTLLNILTGNLAQDRGEIYLGGLDISRTKPHARFRMGVGRTFQNVRPFHSLTVEKNIRVAARLRVESKKVSAEVMRIIELLGLKPYVDEAVSECSLIVRKKTELGKAVVGGAKLVLLDEPFAGLVEEEINDLAEDIKLLREEGVAFVIVEHVVSALMKLANRVFVLHLGTKLAEGTPHEIVKNTDVLQVYLGGQFGSA